MTYYTREVTMPKTLHEGLMNSVQMIINDIEAGNPQEGLLKAVDLLDSLRCGIYGPSRKVFVAVSGEPVGVAIAGKQSDALRELIAALSKPEHANILQAWRDGGFKLISIC